jgi:hypothetical protein
LAQQSLALGVPPAVVMTTLKTATGIAAGEMGAGVLSARAAELAEGVVRGMFLRKLKTAVVVVVALSLLGLGGGLLFHRPAAAEPTREPDPNRGQQVQVVANQPNPPAVADPPLPPPKPNGPAVGKEPAVPPGPKPLPAKQRLGKPVQQSYPLPSLALSGNGKTLAWVTTTIALPHRLVSVQLYDVPTRQPIRTIDFKEQAANANSQVALSADGTMVALVTTHSSGGPQKVTTVGHVSVHCWDVASGKELAQLSKLSGWGLGQMLFPTFSTDGKHLAALYSGGDAKMKQWSLATTNLVKETAGLSDLIGKGPLVYYLSPDAHWLAYQFARGLEAGPVHLRDLTGAVKDRTLQADGTPLAFSRDNHFLVVGREDSVAVWDLKMDKEAGKIKAVPYFDLLQRCDVSPDGTYVAWVSPKKRLELGNVSTGKVCATLDEAACIAFSADGQLLACLCADGTVELWNMAQVVGL